VLTRPSLLLRAEGGIVFGASLLLYGEVRASWILFVVLVLAPDLSMLGYFLGVRLGTSLYNLFHVLVAPVLLIALSIFYKQLWLLPYGLIWTAILAWIAYLGLVSSIRPSSVTHISNASKPLISGYYQSLAKSRKSRPPLPRPQGQPTASGCPACALRRLSEFDMIAICFGQLFSLA
jgi:hypothetical protein